MIAGKRGGAFVVVRGRESRPHGEGRQWVQNAGRRRADGRHGECRVCPRHATQAVSVEYRRHRQGVRGSVQSCMRPPNDCRRLEKAVPQQGQSDTGHGQNDAAQGRRASRWRSGFPRRDSGRTAQRNLQAPARPATADSEAGQTGEVPATGHPHAQRPIGANDAEAGAGADLRGGFLSDLVWVPARSKHP